MSGLGGDSGGDMGRGVMEDLNVGWLEGNYLELEVHGRTGCLREPT